MRQRLLLTIAFTAVLSFAILLLVASGVAAQTDPPASGDWVVSDTTVVTDQTVNLQGGLVVTSTGSLTLENVTLRIHVSSNGQHGIEVQTGGTLSIRDGDGLASTTGDASRLEAVPGSNAYYFIVRSGTSLRISNSFVTDCGHTGMAGNTRLGLFVGTDDASIEGSAFDGNLHGLVLDHAVITVTDSSFTNSTYHGVNAQDSDLTLTRVTLSDNGYEGARIVRGDALLDGCTVGSNRNGLQVRTGANVTLNGTTVRNNFDGLLMQIDANLVVRGSTFIGQDQYGIHAENRGTLVISDSQALGSTRDGLYAFNDIAITSDGNLYRGNIYGVHLNMNCRMTSTDDEFVSNSNSGVYLESTSDLVILGGKVRDNSAGIKAEDASTVEAWGTTVEGCSFEGYSMTDSDLVVHDGSILNCTGGGIVAPAPSTSEWVVHPGNSSRLLDSDIYLSGFLIISGDTVLHDSVVVFRDYTPPSYVGIGVDEGHQDWQNMTFRPETSASAIIFTIGGPVTGSAWYVTVQDAAANNMPAESPVVDAAFEFHQCTFRDSATGLVVLRSDVVFDRCIFTGNDNGVSVDGVTVRFENCTFTANTATDVTPVNGGHAVLVNSTFTPSKVVPAGPGDQWSAWWTVHVKVRFPSGGAAANAVVTVMDKDGATVFTGTTDGNGFIANVLVREHTTAGTVADDRNPHTFNATLGLSSNEGVTNVTGHMLVTLEIADGVPPDLAVTSHSDGDYIRDPVLTLRGTAHDAGSSVYRVEARISSQPWSLCTGTEDWEWTVTLPGDGRYPISVRARDLALNGIVLFMNLTLDTLAPVIDMSIPPTPANGSLVGSPQVTLVGYVDAPDVVVTSGNVTAVMLGTKFTLNVTLVDGVNNVRIRAEDPAGNVAVLVWRLTADLDAPPLTILSPLDGSMYNTTTVTLTGTTDPFVDVFYRISQMSTIWAMLTVSGSGGFSKELTGLSQGVNTLEVMVRDVAGNEFRVAVNFTVDTVPPRLVSTDPVDGTNLNHATLLVSGFYDEPLSAVMVGDVVATVDGTNYTVELNLLGGLNRFTVAAKDLLGNVLLTTLSYYLDTTPPSLDLPGFTFNTSSGDYEPLATNQRHYVLMGTTELGATVFIDRWDFPVDSVGRISADLELVEGDNRFEVMVRDRAGNEYFTNVTLVLDTYAPDLTVESPEHLSTTPKDYVIVKGTVTPGDYVSVGDVEMHSPDGKFELKVALGQAVNRIQVVAFDEAGNTVSVERLVFMKEDTEGLTGNPVLDDNCLSIMIVMIIVVFALAVVLGYAWRGEDVVDRRERALESVLEDDHIEMDKPHLEPTSGYLQYDPTSPTGRKNEFVEKEDEEFISMDEFRHEMEKRGD